MFKYRSESEDAPDWVTAIDIALIADMTVIRHGLVLDARLSEPRGADSLDAAYHLRLTTLQCYVNTGALPAVYAATGAVLRLTNPAAWELTAIGYEAVEKDDGSAHVRLLIRPDAAWLHMQHQLMFTLVPHFGLPGTADSFASTGDDVDFDPAAVERVAAFAQGKTGSKFRPHLDLGVGPWADARAIAAEPFEAFTFRPAGAAIYHLSCDVSARVRLQSWVFPS
jgi:hypothetical protein